MISELSSIGTKHSAANQENQDAICSGKTGQYTAISLADGVSTCEEAKVGAEIASQVINNLFLKKGKYFWGFDDAQIAELAISHILYELNQRAEADKKEVNEYSSTIASVLYDQKKKRLLYFSVGDSMILATGMGGCRVLAMPSNSMLGCCTTTTGHASAMATAKVINVDFLESIIICSDGAWRQMYAKNRLKPEVAKLLFKRKFDGLRDYLISQNSVDDCSFISLDLQNNDRRKSA